ncbi:MAG: hypothetical protein K2Q22_17125, partial [Cytophagales bacterium]|nr:hypothetical protein [Cytophagales bacterium]
ANGISWTSIGSQAISLGSSFFVGVAVTSHRDGTLATAIIDNIIIKKPNLSPTVSLTAPTLNAIFPVGNTVSITAVATDPDGSISKVEFYAGNTFLGTDFDAPYALDWVPTDEGAFSLSAKAFDNGNATATSNSISIRVGNQNPAVVLTSPLAGATFTAQASILLSANASDPDGVVSRVEFYAGTSLLGVDMEAPFTWAWTSVAEGTYVLSAKAFDASNGSATSATVSIKVGNQSPNVALTAPALGAVFSAPASISLTANASDPDGTIAKVDFLQGNVFLVSDAVAPYSFTWTNVAVGTYTITARAFDNQGAVTTSLPRVVQVTTPATIGINGPSCVNIAATNTYLLNAEPNFASANWWSNGDVTITPDPANSRRVTLRINS